MTGIVKTDQIQGAQGTTVTIPTGNTLAVTDNATIGGNLTVDTNTLHVDASNNRVGIGASNNSSYDANARNVLIADESGNTGLTIRSGGSSNYGMIHFADGVSSADEYRAGRIVYEHSSNSMQFSTANALNLMIDGTGAVTKPNQPAFHVHKNSTNVTNIATGDSTLTWAAARFDQNSDFDLANNRFVAPVTGKYFLQVHVRLVNLDTAAVYYFLSLNTSNGEYNFILDPDYFDSDAAYYSIGFSVLADMDANDTVHVVYSQSGGAAQTDIDGRNTYTWFSGHLVC